MKWIAIILIISGFVLIGRGMWWMAVPMILLAVFILLLRRMRFFRRRSKLLFIFTVTGLLALVVTARNLFLKIVWIPSSSMEETLLPGDRVLVSKLAYGPGITLMPFSLSPQENVLKSSFRRLGGFSSVRRNDVVVFIHPLLHEGPRFFIKRCVALPGDTIRIRNGEICINGKPLADPASVKRLYRAWAHDPEKMEKIADSLGIDVWRRYFKGKSLESVSIILTKKERQQLELNNRVDSVRPDISLDDPDEWIEPKDKYVGWTIDNFGPLVIPRKGLHIALDHRNYLLYRRTISQLEQDSLEEKSGRYFLNGEEIDSYTFRHNYYFMMGDNRRLSSDSRYWGFIPEQFIVGRAGLILFSDDSAGVRKDRMLRQIR